MYHVWLKTRWPKWVHKAKRSYQIQFTCFILGLIQQSRLVQQVHNPGGGPNCDLERLRVTHIFVSFQEIIYCYRLHIQDISDAKIKSPKSLEIIGPGVLCNGSFSPEHLPFLSVLGLHCPLQGMPGSVLAAEQAATEQCTYTWEEEPFGPYAIPLAEHCSAFCSPFAEVTSD